MQAGFGVVWGVGGRDQLSEELGVQNRGGFWGLGGQVQEGDKNKREVAWSTSPQQCAAFLGLQSSLASESPQAALKALAN